MTKIKIDESTIKKNPNAGQTIYDIPGIQSIEYEYKGDILPKELSDGKHGILHTNNGNSYFGIIIDNSFLIDFIKRIPKTDSFTVNYRTEIETIRTAEPAPNYLYKYEDTIVPCNNCGNEIIWKEIPLLDDCDERREYCPKCHEIDSFNYKFETIKDLNL